MTEQNREAVRSAGERLARLEGRLGLLCLVAFATAAMAAVTMCIALMGVYVCWNVTTAIDRTETTLEAGRAEIARAFEGRTEPLDAQSQAALEARLREIVKKSH